jgi:transposase-like protein
VPDFSSLTRVRQARNWRFASVAIPEFNLRESHLHDGSHRVTRVDESEPPQHDLAVGRNDTCWVDGCANRKKLLKSPTVRRSPAAERLRALIAEGRVQSQADAVRILGVSRQNISQFVKKHGIQLARAVRPRRARPVCQACRKEYTPGVRSGDGLCFRCNRKPNRVVLRCESCGAERSVTPSAAKERKTDLCKTCYVRERGVLILHRVDRRRRFWQIERNKAESSP